MSYNSSLKEISLDIKNLFLDPNNPRFSDNQKVVPEDKITDEKIQKTAIEKMSKFDLESLAKNIEKNGFLKIDRIIVRKITWLEDKYVVIEWNRRTASLKTILETSLDSSLIKEITNIDVLLYEWSSDSITWFFQWIRHISWIKEWSPYQQAVLLDKTMNEEKVSITDAGEKYWLWKQISARLLRTLYALKAFINDEEFWESAKNEHFSIFEEILKTPTLREYYWWKDEEKKFVNIDKIKLFYQWIQDWIVTSAADDVRKKLPIIFNENDQSLLDELTSKNITLEDSYIRIISGKRVLTEKELDSKFNNMIKELDSIPAKFFTDESEKNKLKENLSKLESKLSGLNNLLKE